MHRVIKRQVWLSAADWAILYDLIEDELERGDELRGGDMWEVDLAAYYVALERLRSRIGYKGTIAFHGGIPASRYGDVPATRATRRDH